MGIKHFRPYTPSRRNMTTSTYEEITKKTPEKSLLASKKLLSSYLCKVANIDLSFILCP